MLSEAGLSSEWIRLALMEGYIRRAVIDAGHAMGRLSWEMQPIDMLWVLRLDGATPLAVVGYMREDEYRWSLWHGWVGA